MQKRILFPYLIITLLLVIIDNSPIYSQWTWQNPRPEGNTLTSICFSDSLNGFAVAVPKNAVKTTDGGNTWNLITSSK